MTIDRYADAVDGLAPDAGEVETAELAVTDDVLVKAFALGPGATVEPHEHGDATNVFPRPRRRADPHSRGQRGVARGARGRVERARNRPRRSERHRRARRHHRQPLPALMDGEIDPDELAALLDDEETETVDADDTDLRIVDIRDRRAFDRGHIPDSECIPFPELTTRIAELEGAARIVTVCPTGSPAGRRPSSSEATQGPKMCASTASAAASRRGARRGRVGPDSGRRSRRRNGPDPRRRRRPGRPFKFPHPVTSPPTATRERRTGDDYRDEGDRRTNRARRRPRAPLAFDGHRRRRLVDGADDAYGHILGSADAERSRAAVKRDLAFDRRLRAGVQPHRYGRDRPTADSELDLPRPRERSRRCRRSRSRRPTRRRARGRGRSRPPDERPRGLGDGDSQALAADPDLVLPVDPKRCSKRSIVSAPASSAPDRFATGSPSTESDRS